MLLLRGAVAPALAAQPVASVDATSDAAARPGAVCVPPGQVQHLQHVRVDRLRRRVRARWPTPLRLGAACVQHVRLRRRRLQQRRRIAGAVLGAPGGAAPDERRPAAAASIPAAPDACATGDGGACGPVGLRAGWPCGVRRDADRRAAASAAAWAGAARPAAAAARAARAGARSRAAIVGDVGRRLPAVQLLVPDVDVGVLRERHQPVDELAARERPGAVAVERHVPLHDVVAGADRGERAGRPARRRGGAARAPAGPGTPSGSGPNGDMASCVRSESTPGVSIGTSSAAWAPPRGRPAPPADSVGTPADERAGPRER